MVVISKKAPQGYFFFKCKKLNEIHPSITKGIKSIHDAVHAMYKQINMEGMLHIHFSSNKSDQEYTKIIS